MMMRLGMRLAAVVAAAVLAGGCQQRSRGPASAEAERLMENPPPAVTGEEPAPSAEAVQPAEPGPAQPGTAQPGAAEPMPAQPAPSRPAEASAPGETPPARAEAQVPPAEAPRAPTTATAPVATAPVVTTSPATRSATTLAIRGTRVHVAADADEAARLRNWPVSVAYYSSGNVVAGPTYRMVPAPPKTNQWWDAVLLHESATTALAVPQFVATPIWMLFTSPFKKVEYHGEEVPPSYTVDEKVPYYENEKVPGIWVIGK